MHLILLILVNISYCISDSSQDNWYETSIKQNAGDWIELRGKEGSISSIPLSNTRYSYAERKLEFQFPFYGEELGSFLATAQGFLYMGSNYGQALYETKYIAPLMAGFGPTEPPLKPQDVRHYSDDTIYINQWSDMSLRLQRDVGAFTFQVQLHSNGVIKFVYKDVPISIEGINSSHVVKVGISDAYLESGYRNLVPYSTIQFNSSNIQPNTSITFTPTPTCGGQKSCKSCIGLSQECVWCPSLVRCSTREGVERYHTLWAQHDCPNAAVNTCLGIKTDTTTKQPDSIYSATSHSTQENITPKFIIPIQIEENIRNSTARTTAPPRQSNSSHSTSMTIVTTISITAVCIAAILVISALLILKLRRPALSPIKVEEIKSCGGGDACGGGNNPRNVQNTSQSYPEYQFVSSEDHEHNCTSVVV